MATLLMRPADGGSADKKRRARKGKNAQKKQPQRGLGVAQLEKLRLQEQSLLCPPPSYSLRLCSPADHPATRCHNDMQTILSLANAQSTGPGSSVVRGEGTARLALSGHSNTQGMSSAILQDETADTKRAVASGALASLSQSSKFSPPKASFFSNVLTTTQLQIFSSSHAQSQALNVDERRVGEAENAPVCIFPTITNSKEATGGHVNGAGFKLHPLFKDVQGIPEPHYLESVICPDVPHLPRKRIELPVVTAGTPSIDNRTNSNKELSSFQSYPSQQAWSIPDKVSGRKRPWLALQQAERHLIPAQALDLNAPAGENDERQSPLLHPENRVGAHYTTGIIRSALGNSCLALGKTKVCPSVLPWQGSVRPRGHFSDIQPDKEDLFRHCTSQSSAKDSCGNVTTSTTYFSLNRKSCITDPEKLEKESICSNFLTLGISSSSYSGSGRNETDENTYDKESRLSTVTDVSRLKKGCWEGYDASPQLRTSACKRQASSSSAALCCVLDNIDTKANAVMHLETLTGFAFDNMMMMMMMDTGERGWLVGYTC